MNLKHVEFESNNKQSPTIFVCLFGGKLDK